MKIFQIASLGFAIINLAGCASNQIIWDHPTNSPAMFEKDRAECSYDAEKYTQSPDPGFRTVFGQELDKSIRQRNLGISCMKSRGYTIKEIRKIERVVRD